MKFLIVFITIGLIACQIKADILENKAAESSSSMESSEIEVCEERICSRIYSPICISLDDEVFNVASMCHLANLRCELMKRLMKNYDAEVPDFRVLHFGECEL